MEQNILEMYKDSRQRNLSNEEIAWLKDAIVKHPYFALPYQILARHTRNTDPVQSGPAVQKAAGFSPNRSLLREYLLHEQISSPIEVAAEVQEEPVLVTSEAEVASSPVVIASAPKVDTINWNLHTRVGLKVSRHLPLSAKISNQIRESVQAIRQAEAQPELETVVETTAPEAPVEAVAELETAPVLEQDLTDLGPSMEVETTSQLETDASQLDSHEIEEEGFAASLSPLADEDFRDEETLETELNLSIEEEIQIAPEVEAEVSPESEEEAEEEVEELIRPLEFSPRGLGPSRKLTSFTAESETDGDLDLTAQYKIGAFSSLSFLEAGEEEKYAPPPAPKPMLRSHEGDDEPTEVVIKEGGRVVEVQVTHDQLERYFVANLELEKLDLIHPAVNAGDENAEEPEPRKQSDAIIDRFIEAEPSISRPDKNRTAGEDYSKPSVMEPDDLVTETLAWIHARQGNNQKAIRMYEKLKLRFPQKSDYFAILISKLKK